uniref:Peroxisomal assembly protein PEX3 n=1 Tax=Rhabditophanes sp. KR3021 TaxID=114890 RepID=A0AC35TTM0_9BILA
MWSAYEYVKKHKKAIIATGAVLAGGTVFAYNYWNKEDENKQSIHEQWESEYNNKIDILKKKREYLLNAYSTSRAKKMQEFYPKILEALDLHYDLNVMKEKFKKAENSSKKAELFNELGRLVIGRIVSFSVTSVLMLTALECQANVMTYEMTHTSKKPIIGDQDSEAFFTQTFLEMITVFASSNNLENIFTKIDEITAPDIEALSLKKIFSEGEFKVLLRSLTTTVLENAFFERIDEKFVPHMKFVKQQQMELVILFEEYVDLLEMAQKKDVVNDVSIKFVNLFAANAFKVIESGSCHYISLMPKLEATFADSYKKIVKANDPYLTDEIQQFSFDRIMHMTS